MRRFEGALGGSDPQQALWLLMAVVCLLSLVPSASAATSRDLLSTICTTPIPKCRPNMCQMKRFEAGEPPLPFCQRCERGYVSAFGGRACVCEAGRYDTGSSCEACGEGYYCPGVRRSALQADLTDPAVRGPRLPCDKKFNKLELDVNELLESGMRTGKTRAVEWTECVTKPGYRLASTVQGLSQVTEDTQTAVVCGDNTYSPGGRRLAQCLPCPRGLVTVGDLPEQHNAANDCRIPPGFYFDRGVGIACPKGTYRSDYTDQATSEPCIPCGEGISTEKAASTGRSACRVVEPGYGALWAGGDGGHAHDATLCPYNSYWPGGVIAEYSHRGDEWKSCLPCAGYLTRQEGSTKFSDCVAPPGFYVDVTVDKGELRECPNNITKYPSDDNPDIYMYGTYRSGWARTPNGIQDCQKCGINMLSEPTETITITSQQGIRDVQVAAGPLSCYIDKDWSLTRDFNTGLWKAAPCPTGTTIGAKEKTYGLLTSVICKPITSVCGQDYMYDRENDRCINKAGWGAYEKRSIKCAPGTWAAEGSMEECKSCGEGRSTLEVEDDSTRDSLTDCVVMRGYGVVNPSALSEDDKWFDEGLPWYLGQDREAQARMEVTECPVGRFSTSTENPDTDVAARCERCPYGSTTMDTGSTIVQDCKYCQAGFGRDPSVSGSNDMQCSLCPRGTYSEGTLTTNSEGYDAKCQPCPTHDYTYQHVDKVSEWDEPLRGPFNSYSTSLVPGAVTEDHCLPIFHQLSSFAGTTVWSEDYFRSVWNNPPNHYVESQGPMPPLICADFCAAFVDCHFAEFRYVAIDNQQVALCYHFRPSWNGTSDTGTMVFYKLPPLSDARIASVKNKSQDGLPDTANSQTTGGNLQSRLQVLDPSIAAVVNNTESPAQLGYASKLFERVNRWLPDLLSTNKPNSEVKANSISSGFYALHQMDANLEFEWGPVITTGYTDIKDAAAACNAAAHCWGITAFKPNPESDPVISTRTGSDPAVPAADSGDEPLFVRTIINAAKWSEDKTEPAKYVVPL